MYDCLAMLLEEAPDLDVNGVDKDEHSAMWNIARHLRNSSRQGVRTAVRDTTTKLLDCEKPSYDRSVVAADVCAAAAGCPALSHFLTWLFSNYED